jgi:biopolymer transport protein ExbB
MNESLDMVHFWAHLDGVARFVLTLLLAGSVLCWYLIVTKTVQGVRRARRSRAFLKTFWDAPNLDAVSRHIQAHGSSDPFSHLLHHGFTALDHLRRRQEASSLIEAGAPDEMLTRALRRAIEEDKAEMEFGQSFLATVASSAPFIGLFGTVWGIYHALAAISLTGQSTLDKVAGPVGEALIMTGIGLAVAIPAAMAYNAFARNNRHVQAKLNSFAYDVFNFMATGIKGSPRLSDGAAVPDKVVELSRAQAGAVR